MKLPGRTPILVELSESEYHALDSESDSKRISMTMIVRDLIREHLMREDLVGSFELSKRFIRIADEGSKESIVIHLANDEHKFLVDYASRKNQSMTHVIRNLIRKYIMNASELPETEG